MAETVREVSKRLGQIGPGTSWPACQEAIEAVLNLELPWITRLGAAALAFSRWLSFAHGLSIYREARGQDGRMRLYPVLAMGLPGPLEVMWGLPVAGLAARDRATQWVADPRLLRRYAGFGAEVAEVVAVPAISGGRLLAVLEVRAREGGCLEFPIAEASVAVAEALAARWPGTQGLPFNSQVD
ncbi:MAG: GAF domain-containing protein [Firmicutes bacterium]|nr:GAF domain-containing protein [Bacillota bacterium]